MKILGIVILSGFFFLLCLIFVIYIFKICVRCREKLRLAAHYKKQEKETKPTKDITTLPNKAAAATSNFNTIAARSQEDLEFVSVSVSSMSDASVPTKSSATKNKNYVAPVHLPNINYDKHPNNARRVYDGSLMRLPRIELASDLESKLVKVPDVFLQVYTTDDIRKLQKEQWIAHGKSNTYSGIKNMGVKVIISVYSKDKSIGGIFLNLEKKFCQQYSYAAECLPWDEKLEDLEENQFELEMKNLLFALLLWETAIIEARTFRCYAGTKAASFSLSDTFFGRQATLFLEHLTQCEDVVLVDSNVLINRNESPKEFAQFIQPAEDVLMCKQNLSEKHIKKTYGIQKFVSSHAFKTSSEGSGSSAYVPTSYYNSTLDTVHKRCFQWSHSFCPTCNFSLKTRK